MGRIRLVTFDLDNTLWDVDSVIREAERVTRRWLIEQVPEAADITPDAYLALRAEALADAPRLAHDVSRLRIEVSRRALLGTGRSAQEAQRIAEAAFELFLHERHKVKYFDGALDALDTLARRYALGSLTNGNADIGRLALARFFRFGISAAEVGASKPDAAMFRAALLRARVTAVEAVHVGDHPVDDIQGASDLGIHTVWVNLQGAAHPDGVTPTRAVAALVELPDRIAEIDD